MHFDSLGKQKFLSLFVVSSITMVLYVVALMADTIIAGHVVGETGISAMNVIAPIISVVVFIGNIIGTGISFLYGSAMGKADKKHADELFGMSVLVAIASGVILFLLVVVGFDTYLAFLSPEAEVMSYAREYYSFYRFVLIIDPLMLLLTSMVYNDGDELISNIANTVIIFGNIILSVTFALVFKMGMAGLALGTLMNDIISLIILSCHFLRKSNSLNPRMYFSLKDLWGFLYYGFVDSGMFLMWGLLLFALNKFIITNFGGKFLPTVSMAISLLEFSAVFDGVAEAVIPLVSVYYAEKNYPAVRKVMDAAIWVSVIEGAIFSVAVFVFADYLPAIFGIDEPEVLGYCVTAVRIISTTLIISSVLYLFETYYMTQGKNIIALVSSFSRNLVFIVLASVPLGLALGINGVWIAFALAQPVTLGICVWLSVVKYGRENFPMYLEDGGNIADFDLSLTPDDIMKTRDKAEKFMVSKNVPDSVMNRIMLMIEETGMMIIERNAGKKVLAEYTIELYGENQARLIVRDNGEIFDITSDDVKVTSLRSYFLSGLMTLEKYRQNITTISFNRNVFTIK